MTTVELEIGISELVEIEEEEEHDERLAHLYADGELVALCGASHTEDAHYPEKHEATTWEQGMLSCPKCGIPLCMNCVLAAS